MRFLACIVMLVLGGSLWADEKEPSLGPVVEGYGPTYSIADRDVALRDGFIYNVVFDAAANADHKSLNTRLVSIARFLNMHVRNGVAPEQMNVAMVAHGPALKTLLTDTAYQGRFGIANPNSELVRKLAAAGVSIYVCGQSMAFGGYRKDELVDSAQVALSAMTMLTVLQTDGFALLP